MNIVLRKTLLWSIIHENVQAHSKATIIVKPVVKERKTGF